MPEHSEPSLRVERPRRVEPVEREPGDPFPTLLLVAWVVAHVALVALWLVLGTDGLAALVTPQWGP